MGPETASETHPRNTLRKQLRFAFQLFPVADCLKSSQLCAIASFRICNIVDSNELVGHVLVLMFIYLHPARIKGRLDKLAVL
jgi:hypothetical protein